MIRKLLNPNANEANSLKLLESQSGCCGDGKEICKLTITDDNAIVLRGLKIKEDGVVTATMLADIPGGPAMITTYGALGTDAAKVVYLRKTILPALFKAAGYIVESKSDIQISSDLKSFVFIGEADITAIVDSNPADITVDEKACTKITICDYATNYAGGTVAFTVSINGTDYTVTPAADFNYPADLADLNAKLTAALSAVTISVVAIDDTANSAFKITIVNPSGQDIVIAGNAVQCCDVRADFEV